MQSIEFSNWFQTKALSHLKQSIMQLNKIMDEQIQIHNLNNKNSNSEIPPDYLAFHVENYINSVKINLLSELQQTSFNEKFTFDVKEPIDKPIQLKQKNTLIQRAKLFMAANTMHSLPQLAFVDIEIDGTNINTANMLQIAIVKPIIDPEYNSLSHFTTWSIYTLPWKGYTQNDNKAFHINHIGDKELKKALHVDNAIFHITYHLYNTVIVGYNVNNFDIPIIKKYCEDNKEPLLHKYSIDLYPAIWKNKKQKLGDAIKAYNLPLNSNPHDAIADASCCIDLLNEILERHELPNTEEDLIDLFNSSENEWHHYYKNYKIVEINSDYKDYSQLLYLTLTSSLKRKLSQTF